VCERGPSVLVSNWKTIGSPRVPYVNYVLALVALLGMWAGAAGLLADMNGVNVPSRACNLNGLFGTCVCASSGAIKDKHPLGHGTAKNFLV